MSCYTHKIGDRDVTSPCVQYWTLPFTMNIGLFDNGAFQSGKADRHSLDFIFNCLCMKLFKTGSIDVVKDCQSYFATDLPSCDLKRRQDKFILRYISTVNGFCQFCNKLLYIIRFGEER